MGHNYIRLMHASFLRDLPVVDDGCNGSCLVACTGPRVGASDFIIYTYCIVFSLHSIEGNFGVVNFRKPNNPTR